MRKDKNTTVVGYVNKNNQRNMGNSNKEGTGYGQMLYNMECQLCHFKYFANGCDVWQRKCPICQNGKP